MILSGCRGHPEDPGHAGYRVIEDDIINIQNYVRHDSGKLARIVMDPVQKTLTR